MAQATNTEFILRKVQTEGLKYWKVLDSDGKNELDIQDDTDMTPDESAAKLRVTLENLTGLVLVKLSAKSKSEKGAGAPQRDAAFWLKLGEPGINGISGHGAINNNSVGAIRESMQREFDEKLARIREQYEHKKEIEEMKRQIAEIRSSDPLEKYAPHLLGLMGMTPPVMPAAPPAPVALAGTDQSPEEGGKARLVAALNRIMAKDPNFIRNLEKVADLAEKKPEVYEIVITNLYQI